MKVLVPATLFAFAVAAAAPAAKPLELHLVVDCDAGTKHVTYAHQGISEDLCLAPDVIVSRADIKAAQVYSTGYGDEAARLTLAQDAARRLGTVTTANVGKRIAVIYDGHVVFAPMVQEPITGNQLEITVGSTGDSVEAFVADLNGAPAP